MNGDLETLRKEVKALRGEFEQFRTWAQQAITQIPGPAPVDLQPLERRIKNVEEELEGVKNTFRTMPGPG
jgi:hypothetical protein